MNEWQKQLTIKLETLGDNPTAEQRQILESWVLEHVPAAFWRDVAPTLPMELCEAFMMRGAEMGF